MEKKFGYIKFGPGSEEANQAAELKERERIGSQRSESRDETVERDVSMSLDVTADFNPSPDITMESAREDESQPNPAPSTPALESSISQASFASHSAPPQPFRNPRSEAQFQEDKAISSATLDAFIADMSVLPDPKDKEENMDEDEDEDEDDEDDEDFEERDSQEEDGDRSRKKQKQSKGKGKEKAGSKKSKSKKSNDDEDEQVLSLSGERFSVPEVLFAPNQIGELRDRSFSVSLIGTYSPLSFSPLLHQVYLNLLFLN